MPHDSLSSQVQENVDKIASLASKAEEQINRHQRVIERLTAQLGRPRTLYCVAACVLGWLLYNGVALRVGARPFDPAPFPYLQSALTILSVLMTTMVLTTQNRQGHRAMQRAHLDLQVNLLSEQKVAKIISLLEELRRDLPQVPNRDDPVAAGMASAVDPARVVSEIERSFDDAQLQPDAKGAQK